MNQNAISRLENPYYGKSTLTTLKRIASAYDVGLLVEFVPFSRLVDRVSGTPHTDNGLSPSTMNVQSFEEEIGQGLLEENPDTRSANALELSRPYLESIPTGTPGLLPQSAIEQSAESDARFDFSASPASGAIHTTVAQTSPTGSYYTALGGPWPRETHWRARKRPRDRGQWLQNKGRRLTNRGKRYA